MKYLFSLYIIILFSSCSFINNEENDTYFGGEIINPKSDIVVLLKDEKVIDTLKLDANNHFLKKYNSFNEGLYTFKQGFEFQYIYLKPGDSLLVRLNTWDFDESLVFSGKGAAKNEFLINLFLQNERDDRKIFSYFKLNEKNFEHKIDSISTFKNKLFNEFIKNHSHTSDGFKKVISAAINFPLYRLKEMYPFYYKKYHHNKSYPNVSKSFYDFRKNIKLNDINLMSFYQYQNYVISYLYNLSYQLKEKDSTKNNITLNFLNATIEHIKLEDFKNSLLQKFIINDFLKSNTTCKINKEALAIFNKYCTNKQYLNFVNNLVNDSKFVLNNKPLQDFEIVTYQNDSTSIAPNISNKNAVIYFWSNKFMTSDFLVSRIKYLENKFPAIDFIGINMDSSFKALTNEPALSLLDNSKQFKLTSSSVAQQFLTSKYPRIIIVNKNGIVVNGFTYLNASNLGSELKKLK